MLPTHGDLLATYTQDASFSQGETKNVVFTHTEEQRDEKRRDIGVEVIIAGKVVISREFDDAYTWPLSQLPDWTQMIGLVAVMAMMGMVVPMMEGE